jgi:hypothetical protein
LAPVLRRDGRQAVWMRTDDVLGVLRSAALAKEFDLDVVLLGNGDEYRQLVPVRKSGARLVVPVAFPDAPRVDDADEALAVDLETLRHWEAAPDNPRRLQDAGIAFAITSHKLPKRAQVLARVRTAIEHGLKPETALDGADHGAREISRHRYPRRDDRDGQAGRFHDHRWRCVRRQDARRRSVGRWRTQRAAFEGRRAQRCARQLASERRARCSAPTLRLEGSEWTLRGHAGKRRQQRAARCSALGRRQLVGAARQR